MNAIRIGFAGSCLYTLLLARGAAAASAADPCDFATGEPIAFTHEQVTKCYESVPFRRDDLRKIVAVIEQHRSFSDLAEIYESRVQWQESLRTVGQSSYSSDFAMHEALKAEHKNFRNAHVTYMPPSCYWRMVNAFVPLDFGATTRFARRAESQVIFVEDAPYLPDVYQQFTGIDARQFVGMKVVEINGTPILDYFRQFGREQMKNHEDDGGHLNAILNHAAYSVRIGYSDDSIPTQPHDEYVFESRKGERVRVKLPWIFAPSRPLFGDSALPLTRSIAEFHELCLRSPTPASATANASGRLLPNWLLGVPFGDRKHRALQACTRRPPRDTDGFFEVPPDALDRGVETIIPRTGSAEVFQYGEHTTVLRVHDTLGWVDVARQGIAHACEHSQRLIVDVRGNGGGKDTVIEWLHRHLFPRVQAPVQTGKFAVRIRNDNAAFNEALFNMASLDALLVPEGAEPCSAGIGPACLVNVNSGGFLPLQELQWFRWPSFIEHRGGQQVSLSRQVGLPPEDPSVTFDSASCAGRFTGDKLIFLTDGRNASGGYFLPAAFKGEAVIVTMGGFVDEPMAMGRARGGSTLAGSTWATLARAIPELSGGALTFRSEYAESSREVDTYMEMTGIYRKDRRTLHVEQPVETDFFLDLWSDTPSTAGYVYQHVIDAVDARRGRRSRGR